MRPLVTVLVSFLLAASGTLLFIRWVQARAIVALPNHRTMHKGAVALGGGLPLLAAMLTAAVLIWPLRGLPRLLLPALIVLALVSWADDMKATPALPRLVVHIAAATACMLSLPGNILVLHGHLPWVLDRLVCGLALVWFLNLYNFMDGIDGIAGVETVTIAAGFAAVSLANGAAAGPLHALAFGAIGATCGFLIWNWPPARIFLGDVGSVPLGFLMGWLMFDVAVHHSLVAAVIPPLYFAADATLTLARRVVAGARPWEPHREHFYQRAAAGIGAHEPVTIAVLVCNSVLLIAAVLALTAPFLALAIAVSTVMLLLSWMERSARHD